MTIEYVQNPIVSDTETFKEATLPTHAVIREGTWSTFTDDPNTVEGECILLPPNFFDYPQQAWTYIDNIIIENVPYEKDRIWNEVKTVRDNLIDSGCTTPYGVVQTNKSSRDVIKALAEGTVFPVYFTLKDNTSPPRTQEEMLEIWNIVQDHVQSIWNQALIIREAITDSNVTTLAQLYSIPTEIT